MHPEYLWLIVPILGACLAGMAEAMRLGRRTAQGLGPARHRARRSHALSRTRGARRASRHAHHWLNGDAYAVCMRCGQYSERARA